VGEPGAGRRAFCTSSGAGGKDGDPVVIVGPDPYIADVPHYAPARRLLTGKTPEQILTEV
jgi:hypothetical protein